MLSWTQVGRWQNSETIYRHTLAVTKKNHVIHYNLGTYLTGRGRSEEAMVHYRKAIDIFPDYHKAHNNLGFELAGRGRVTEAIGHYEAALRSAPDSWDAHNNLANALVRQGRLDSATAHYRMALQANPRFAGAHKNMGLALLRQGKIAAAILHLDRSLQLAPDNRVTQHSLALARSFDSRIKKAADAFRQSLRCDLDPDAPGLSIRLSDLSQKKTDLVAAIEAYANALATQPWFDRKALDMDNIDPVRAAGTDYADALPRFEKSLPGTRQMHRPPTTQPAFMHAETTPEMLSGG